MENTRIVRTPKEMDDVAKALIESCKNEKIFAFYGEIGAGKTTLIQAICRLLGVEENVASPTFALVHEYESTHQPIYHLDLYRLKSVQEAMEIDLPGYLFSDTYCFIEWPGLIEELLPNETVKVYLEHLDENSRKITIHVPQYE